jgi:hypothetical protein
MSDEDFDIGQAAAFESWYSGFGGVAELGLNAPAMFGGAGLRLPPLSVCKTPLERTAHRAVAQVRFWMLFHLFTEDLTVGLAAAELDDDLKKLDDGEGGT